METDRIIIITGAAGAVGSVLVKRFLANGDTVLATDTKQDTLDTWRKGFGEDAKLSTFTGDISDADDTSALAEAARQRYGRVDVLINCAGYFPIVLFEEMSVADWRTVIDINLTGSFLTTRAVLPLMKDRGWGRVINFGSGSVYDGTRGQAHYVAAKAGIIGFTRSLAREIGGYGITVNAVTPGLTRDRRRPRPLSARALADADRPPGHPARGGARRPGRPGVLSRVAGLRLHLRTDAQHRRRQLHI